MKFKTNVHAQRVSFPLDAVLSGEEVLLAAAHVFSPRADVWTENAVVELEARGARLDAEGLMELARDFREELAAQELRRRIASENKTVREYVIVSALLAGSGESGNRFEKTEAAPAAGGMQELILEAEKELEGKAASRQEPSRLSDPKAILKAWNESGAGS